MLCIPSVLFALAATGLAAVPDGYRKVLIPSKVNTAFVVVPVSAATGSLIVVQSKTGAAGQQWYLQNGNSSIIYGPDTTLCLDAGAQSNWKDMSRISLVTCAAGSASQQWDVMADGRIALVASKPQECVDLQYSRAVANNPVGIYSCAGLGGIGAADDGLNWPLANATS